MTALTYDIMIKVTRKTILHNIIDYFTKIQNYNSSQFSIRIVYWMIYRTFRSIYEMSCIFISQYVLFIAGPSMSSNSSNVYWGVFQGAYITEKWYVPIWNDSTCHVHDLSGLLHEKNKTSAKSQSNRLWIVYTTKIHLINLILLQCC